MLWHTIHVRVAIVKFDSELPFPYEISTPMASHPKQLPHTSPFHVLVVFLNILRSTLALSMFILMKRYFAY